MVAVLRSSYGRQSVGILHSPDGRQMVAVLRSSYGRQLVGILHSPYGRQMVGELRWGDEVFPTSAQRWPGLHSL